eukprot:1224878-Amphidinium_carterae.4
MNSMEQACQAVVSEAVDCGRRCSQRGTFMCKWKQSSIRRTEDQKSTWTKPLAARFRFFAFMFTTAPKMSEPHLKGYRCIPKESKTLQTQMPYIYINVPSPTDLSRHFFAKGQNTRNVATS